jgi:hypothetical protein
VSDSKSRKSSKPPSPGPSENAGHHQSSGATGSSRAGRRETPRPSRAAAKPPLLQRLRTPILVIAVVALVAGVGTWVFTSAAAPAYACSSVDSVKAAVAGEIGQVQADQGNGHVQQGDKITYAVCPPASGKHINKEGYGPLKPQVYGPDDRSEPNGWVHNLEHGGLVLLYSCDKGACDTAGLAALDAFDAGFPASPICQIPPGKVGPVIARFEDMPTKYAALVWDRVLYLDSLDAAAVYDLYTQYGERVAGGSFIAPPEPQCLVPSPSPSAGS